jgi:methyltransferase (TIGR00027 family)
VAATVFRAVQAAALPIGIVGYAAFAVRLVQHTRRSGTSGSVLASLYTRYMQHELGTRQDEPCERVMRTMPSVSPVGLALSTTPTLVAHRLTGYVPKLYRYPYEGVPPMRHQSVARTTFYDQALERHLPRVGQFVVLGAGYDTRAYRLPEGTPVRCFEVDMPRTQALKREVLARAGVDAARVTFVPADFEEEDWLEKLLEAGFSLDVPSFFSWESVAMYLEREAVESTLRTIAGTAPGGALAFDYLSTRMVEGPSNPYWRYSRAWLKATGEPWKFGIDATPPIRDRVAALLESCGLQLEEHRTFGVETGSKEAMAGFATALVPAPPNGGRRRTLPAAKAGSSGRDGVSERVEEILRTDAE